jgi:hypothetical protein
VGFATTAGCARSILQDANIPPDLRKRLMLEAVKTATILDGVVPVDVRGVFKTKFLHQFGANPPFTRAL